MPCALSLIRMENRNPLAPEQGRGERGGGVTIVVSEAIWGGRLREGGAAPLGPC